MGKSGRHLFLLSVSQFDHLRESPASPQRSCVNATTLHVQKGSRFWSERLDLDLRMVARAEPFRSTRSPCGLLSNMGSLAPTPT